MYIKQRSIKGRIPKEWYKDVEKSLIRFIEEVDNNTDNTLFESEGTCGDCEASYLSQLIFRNIFNKFKKETFFCCKKYLMVQNYRFYFDIMNNPKYKSKKNNKQKRIGKKIDEKYPDKYAEWIKIYHTLGNFAPYPYILIDNSKVQLYHECKCYERWDLTLIALQKEWNNHKDIPMSFNDYLIFTGQIIYDKNVFSNIPSDEDITVEWYRKQSENISEKEIQLINFNCESNVSNNKILTDNNVEYAINTILKLIRVRTKILLLLLKEY